MKTLLFVRTFFIHTFIIAMMLGTTLAYATAGVPTIISYQGRLTDQNGILLGGTGTTYFFKFSIWDSATVGAGSRLWPASAPTALPLSVTDGVFDVNIGDITGGYPDVLDYDFQSNETVYLQVEVSPTGSTYETLGPRSRITSSSTAINSKTLEGLPGSYYLDADNLTNFFTRSLTTPLTGFVATAGTITSADTLLSAIEKLSGNLQTAGQISSVFGRTGAITAQSGDYTTALVAESGNLYYTQGRFDTAFGLKTTTNLTEGTNLYYTDVRFDTRLAAKTTTDLTEGINLYYTDGRTRAALSSTGPVVYDDVTGVISSNQAGTATDGYLSSTDWNTFNAKQAALTTGTTTQYFRGDLSLATFPTALSSFTNDAGYLTIAVASVAGTTNRITSSGGTTPVIDISSSYVGQSSITTLGTITTGVWNGTAIEDAYIANAASWNAKENALTFSTPLVRTVNTISIPVATTSVDGYLTTSDWNTFNNKFSLPSLTTGSVLFSNGTSIAQDNAKFFWDDTNNRLGIRTTNPLAALDVIGAVRATENTTGYSEFTHANASGFANFPRAYFKIYGGGSETNSALYVSPGNATGTTQQPVFFGLSTNSNVKQAGSKQALLYLTTSAFSLITNDAEVSGVTKIPWYLGGTQINGSDANLVLLANGNIGIGTATPTTGKLVIADTTLSGSGSLTGSVLDISQTWNTTGIPTAIKLNVTDTASGSGSLLMDLQSGGVSGLTVYSNRVGTNPRLLIRAPSSLATSPSLKIQNSGGTDVINFSQSGHAFFLNPIYVGSSTLSNVNYGITSSQLSYAATSGAYGSISAAGNFSPSSGTATFAYLYAGGAINQTGSATGISRGIYIVPTLQSVTGEWRAIESTTGRVIFADTYAAGSGSLAGSLLDLTQTWNTTGNPTAIKLNVTDTASNGAALLMDLQAGGVSQFRVSKTGGVTMGAGTIVTGYNNILTQQNNVANVVNHYQASVSAGGIAATSGGGTGGIFLSTVGFIPTSGTAALNNFAYTGTINQTGGANGITRGLFINPTLTAAADFRAIELTNNTGRGVYQSGTATNYFNGNIGIGQIIPTAKLHISSPSLGTTHSDANGLLLENPTLATVGLSQSPPDIVMTGNGWSTGGSASQRIGYRMRVDPANGGVSTSSFYLDSYYNGAYQNEMTLNNFTGNRGVTFAGGGTFGGSVIATTLSLAFNGTGLSFSAGQGSIANSSGTFNYASNASHNFSTGVISSASGTGTLMTLNSSFAPTSGTAVYNALSMGQTINQTGGANGITRGLFINPTLTAAADFRAIELTNNTGRGVYQSGTAVNNFLGATAIGTISAPVASAILDINSTTRGVLLPRMTTTEMNAIASPATGLQIYNTTDNVNYTYNGTTWVGGLTNGTQTIAGAKTFSSAITTGSSVPIIMGVNGIFVMTSRLRITGTSDGVIVLTNSLDNNFGRLQLGGTTSAFPSIKRNGTGIDIRLADDSGFGGLAANNLVLADTTLAGSGVLAGGVLDMAQTWNTTGTPTAIKLNVTDTSSNASSLLMDLQNGGISQFRVSKGGAVTAVTSFNVGSSALTTGAVGVGSGGVSLSAVALGVQVSSGRGWLMRSNFTSGVADTSLTLQNTNTLQPTSGTSQGISVATTFSPTSGTAVRNTLVLSDTINQTGTATGITRGIFINPTLTAAADFRAIELASADYGAGVAGLSITLGYNTNAIPGAGSINYVSNTGTAGYVWQDAAGNLRINTSAPTNANDTAGTVVGAQTSTRETKQDIADYTSYNDALALVVNAPLHTFRYVREVEGYGSDSLLAKTRIGYIADEVDPVFMVGNSIDQVSVNGLLIASIKALDIKLHALPDIQDQSLGSKIAEFLRGIAENGIAIVDGLKTKKVETEELCIGDDTDQVCVTKEQLRTLLGNQATANVSGPTTMTPEPTPEAPLEQTPAPEFPTEETPSVAPEPTVSEPAAPDSTSTEPSVDL